MAENVAVAGSYAYVADGLNGLRVIDVSNPSAPDEVGAFTAQNFYARGVAIKGSYAYVTDFGGPLRVINVSNPANPTEVGSYNATGNPYGLEVSGNYAYIAAESSGLRIADVSDPANPTEVGFSSTPDPAWDVATAKEYAYVAARNSGLRVVDVSNPANPTEVGFYDTPGQAKGVAVERSFAYVADGESGLRIIDVSNPVSPTEQTTRDPGGDANDVAVAEGYVYVAAGTAGLAIFEFAPFTVGPIPGDGGELTSPYDDTTYEFPSGAFTDTVIITHTPRFAGDVPPFGDLVSINHIFEVTAVYSSTGKPAQLAPGFTYTMTVQYAQEELGMADEKTLALYYWDGAGQQWVSEPTSSLAVGSQTVTASPDHLSYWAVLGQARRVLLPLILKER